MILEQVFASFFNVVKYLFNHKKPPSKKVLLVK